MGRIPGEIETEVSSMSVVGVEAPDVDHQSCVEWPFSSGSAVEDGEGGDQRVNHMMTKKKKNQVLLEGYVEAIGDEDDLVRTKSLTDEDLDELKGCLDLGFGFSYEEIPELCNTLPALELCYSMSRKFNDESLKSPERELEAPDTLLEPAASPVANWRISSPGKSFQ